MPPILPNFRNNARESLKRAKTEMATNDPDKLRYAALELRYAMEALTYDRAAAFKEEIPPEEYKTWQPRKLMLVLHDIDPSIGMTSTISIGHEESYGVPVAQEKMEVLGTDTVFTLKDLKAHYDAIGSFLHMPSLEQVEAGYVADSTKLRSRCEEIVTLIDKVLSSHVWNSTIGAFASLDQCMNVDCKKPIRKRIPIGKNTLEARCFECKSEYTITSLVGGKVCWSPKMKTVSCPTQDCPENVHLWPHQITPGTWWHCQGCGTDFEIMLLIQPIDSKTGNDV